MAALALASPPFAAGADEGWRYVEVDDARGEWGAAGRPERQ